MAEDVYAWAVEFPSHQDGKQQVAFFPNDGRYDESYVMNYATRLHGLVIPLFRERRHDGREK